MYDLVYDFVILSRDIAANPISICHLASQGVRLCDSNREYAQTVRPAFKGSLMMMFDSDRSRR